MINKLATTGGLMTDQPTNVVPFPTKNFNPFTQQNLEELKAVAFQQKQETVAFLVEEIMEDLFMSLMSVGINVGNDNMIKDVVLVEEAISSLLLKSANLPHPLQEAAEKLISVVDDEPKEVKDNEDF